MLANELKLYPDPTGVQNEQEIYILGGITEPRKPRPYDPGIDIIVPDIVTPNLRPEPYYPHNPDPNTGTSEPDPNSGYYYQYPNGGVVGLPPKVELVDDVNTAKKPNTILYIVGLVIFVYLFLKLIR